MTGDSFQIRMKPSIVITAVLVALALGFIGGRTSERAAAEKKEKETSSSPDRRQGRTRVAERPEKSAGAVTATQRFRDEIKKAAPHDVSAMVYRALEESDPLIRRQLLLEICARMDAGNFEAMIRESERSSLESSRNNYDEWAAVLIRSGQVAGESAMNLWSGDLKHNWDQLAKTMHGWASADPEAAMRWIEKSDLPPMSHGNMLSALLSGAISRDRHHAMTMLANLPEEERTRCISQFTHHLVQNSGKEGAIEWLTSVRNSNSGSEYTAKVTDSVFDKIVWAGSNLNNASTVIADLERVSPVIAIDEGRISRAISQFRAREPVRGIDLLDQLTRSPLLKNQPPTQMMATSSIGFAVQRDRAGVEKWVADHPGSSLIPKIQEALAAPPPEQNVTQGQ